MIITELYGGLGNQLFEYSHARALAQKLNQEVYFDLTFFEEYHRSDVYRLDRFNLKIVEAEKKDITRLKKKAIKPKLLRKLFQLLGLKSHFSAGSHFDQEKLEISNTIESLKNKDMYISGYFADQKYFTEIKDTIKQELTLKEALNLENEKMLSRIRTSNSISLHIRRGDYVENSYFASISLDYYSKGINFIKNKFPNPVCFVFSDDIGWVKENLKVDVEMIFVDINDETTDYMELILMSACKHNIIANSTFSWWGAWLNSNLSKIVIAPKVWFNDENAQSKYSNGALVPIKWIKI